MRTAGNPPLRAGSVAAPYGRKPTGRGGCPGTAGHYPPVAGCPLSRWLARLPVLSARPLALGILLPRKDHSQERSLRSRPADGAPRHS